MEKDTTFLYIGYVGTFLASIRLFPQVYRTVTVNCSSVSLATLFLDFMSCVFFLIYAIHMNTMPMILSNVISGMANIVIAIVVLKKRNVFKTK